MGKAKFVTKNQLAGELAEIKRKNEQKKRRRTMKKLQNLLREGGITPNDGQQATRSGHMCQEITDCATASSISFKRLIGYKRSPAKISRHTNLGSIWNNPAVQPWVKQHFAEISFNGLALECVWLILIHKNRRGRKSDNKAKCDARFHKRSSDVSANQSDQSRIDKYWLKDHLK